MMMSCCWGLKISRRSSHMSTIKEPSCSGGSGMGMSRAAKKRKRLSDCIKRNSPTPTAETASSIFINLEDKAFKKVDSKSNKSDTVVITTTAIEGSGDFLKVLNLKEVLEITSKERAALLLSYIIYPINLEQFYTMHWQKAPLNISHHMPSHWDKILTTKKLRIILKKTLLVAGRDVSFYSLSEKKNNSKPSGEIRGNDLFSACMSGHTVLLLNPIKYIDILWQLCSALEHEFSAAVGCRVFLSSMTGSGEKEKTSTVYEESFTGADSFLLQLDNHSTWTTGNPNEDGNKTTSPTSCTLEMGDVLYVPKGWSLRQTLSTSTPDTVNQSPQSNPFSLTLQIYTNESNSVGDILELLLPQAIQKAATASRILRNALPKDFNYFMGVAATEQQDDDAQMNDRLQQEEKNPINQFQSPTLESRKKKDNHHSKQKKTPVSQTPVGGSNVNNNDIDDQEEIVAQQESMFNTSGNGSGSDDPRRMALLHSIRRGLKIMSDAAMSSIDACFDQYIAKELVLKRLPVPLTAEEEAVTAAGAPHATIFPYTRLRMVRPGIASVAVEDGKVVLYHCMDNSRENRLLQAHLQEGMSDCDGEDDLAAPFVPLEFELDDGPTIEALIRAYPNSVEVSELYHPSEELEDKIAVAQALYKEGFLLIEDVASLPRGAELGRDSNENTNDDDPF